MKRKMLLIAKKKNLKRGAYTMMARLKMMRIQILILMMIQISCGAFVKNLTATGAYDYSVCFA